MQGRLEGLTQNQKQVAKPPLLTSYHHVITNGPHDSISLCRDNVHDAMHTMQSFSEFPVLLRSSISASSLKTQERSLNLEDSLALDTCQHNVSCCILLSCIVLPSKSQPGHKWTQRSSIYLDHDVSRSTATDSPIVAAIIPMDATCQALLFDAGSWHCSQQARVHSLIFPFQFS